MAPRRKGLRPVATAGSAGMRAEGQSDDEGEAGAVPGEEGALGGEQYAGASSKDIRAPLARWALPFSLANEEVVRTPGGEGM